MSTLTLIKSVQPKAKSINSLAQHSKALKTKKSENNKRSHQIWKIMCTVWETLCCSGVFHHSPTKKNLKCG